MVLNLLNSYLQLSSIQVMWQLNFLEHIYKPFHIEEMSKLGYDTKGILLTFFIHVIIATQGVDFELET